MKQFSFSLAAILVALSSAAQDWNQLIKHVSTDRTALEYYGFSVDLSGDYAIVGSYWDDDDPNGMNPITDAGSAFILGRDNMGNWTQVQKLVANDRQASSYYGYSVAIEGDIAAVGAYAQSTDENGANSLQASGAVYIYERNSSTGVWSQTQKIVQSDRVFWDFFGTGVDLSGDRLIAGAWGQDTDENGANSLNSAGAAYVFERAPITGIWTQSQKLVPSDRVDNEQFGIALRISGDLIVAGANFNDTDENTANYLAQAGAAYIWQADGAGVWTESAKVVAPDRATEDRFGWKVATDGQTVAIGAIWQDFDENGSNYVDRAGAVYLFEESAPNTWTFQQKVVCSSRENVGIFGLDLDVDGDRMIVGSGGEDQDFSGATVFQAGGVFVFERDPATGTWSETELVAADDRMQNDQMGEAVRLEGDVFIAGVYKHNFDENGMNEISDAGAAYIFEYTPNPCSLDSDEDGISDCDETDVYGTDPFDCDSDNDGLTDGLEVNQSGTDPTLQDTDNDGCTDDLEFSLQCPDSVCDDCPYDLNDDGQVGTSDLLDLLGNFGMMCP